MSVKKIFVTLITIVALVVVGAFVLNIILPNATSSLVDTTEKMIYNASGLSFDFNGNGVTGKDGETTIKSGTGDKATQGTGVQGFSD